MTHPGFSIFENGTLEPLKKFLFIQSLTKTHISEIRMNDTKMRQIQTSHMSPHATRQGLTIIICPLHRVLQSTPFPFSQPALFHLIALQLIMLSIVLSHCHIYHSCRYKERHLLQFKLPFMLHLYNINFFFFISESIQIQIQLSKQISTKIKENSNHLYYETIYLLEWIKKMK